MKVEEFCRAFGNIREDYIAEAHDYYVHSVGKKISAEDVIEPREADSYSTEIKSSRKLLIVMSCVALIVVIGIGLFLNSGLKGGVLIEKPEDVKAQQEQIESEDN